MSNLALNKDEKNKKDGFIETISEEKLKFLKLNLEELIFIDDHLSLMVISGPFDKPLSKSFHNYLLVPANYELIHNVIQCINYLKKSGEKDCILETSNEDLFILREISKSYLNQNVVSKNSVTKNLKFKICELLAGDFEYFKKQQQAKKFFNEQLFKSGGK